MSSCSSGTCSVKLARRNDSLAVFSSKPPHQVGHAGQQLAVGRVDAHALAQRHQRVLDRLGHAVEHLELVAARRQAEDLGRGQGVGQAADVVAAEGRPQHVVVLQQEARQLLVSWHRSPTCA